MKHKWLEDKWCILEFSLKTVSPFSLNEVNYTDNIGSILVERHQVENFPRRFS